MNETRKKIPDFWARDPFREDCIIPRTKLEIKYTVGSKLFPDGGKQKFGVKVSSRVYRREAGGRNRRVGYINGPATLNIVDLWLIALSVANKMFKFLLISTKKVNF